MRAILATTNQITANFPSKETRYARGGRSHAFLSFAWSSHRSEKEIFPSDQREDPTKIILSIPPQIQHEVPPARRQGALQYFEFVDTP
jgi:hypothetical protein